MEIFPHLDLTKEVVITLDGNSKRDRDMDSMKKVSCFFLLIFSPISLTEYVNHNSC